MKLKTFLLLPAMTLVMALFFSRCSQSGEYLKRIEREQIIKPPTYSVFLPVVERHEPKKMGKVAVDLEQSWSQFSPWYNPNAYYKISCSWAAVENTWSKYDWSSCDRKVGPTKPYWVVFKLSPPWALAPGQPPCKLPKKTFWPNAAFFLQNLIDRYKPNDPNQPFFIEVWNEPNAHWADMNWDLSNYFGCVGEEGGTLYGEFYTYLRNHTSGADLVLGAVSFANDPFLKEAIKATGDRVDAVSYHCYPNYYNNILDTAQCKSWYPLVDSMTKHPVYLSETAVHYRSGTIFLDPRYNHTNNPQYYSYEQAQVDWFSYLTTLPNRSNWYSGYYNGWPVCTPNPCNTDTLTYSPKLKKVIPRPVWHKYMAQ